MKANLIICCILALYAAVRRPQHLSVWESMLVGFIVGLLACAAYDFGQWFVRRIWR